MNDRADRDGDDRPDEDLSSTDELVAWAESMPTRAGDDANGFERDGGLRDVDHDVGLRDVEVDGEEWVGDQTPESGVDLLGDRNEPAQRGRRPEARFVAAGRDVAQWFRENSAPICLSLTLAGIAVFTIVFGSLSVQNHRNFGTWAYDGAIYDQAIWLVSRGGQTFMTVRGMDVWGHHLNLVLYLFAPFYRFGAGPELLYVVQNFTIALAALPVYLIAKDRFGRPSIGLAFVAAYLMYAPIQWISWINFHPEAMVIAPFLFAWWFSMRKRWGWFFVSVLLCLIMREDAALAVIMLGVVLLITNRHSPARRRDAQVALGTLALGAIWYVVATKVVIPHFNDGGDAFYLEFFFAEWGGSLSGIAQNVVRHPDRVLRYATESDRLTFYRQLTFPLGGLALASPLHLLMAAPQMLASVIGGSPYARQILYQYTSIMIAPIMIASIEGAFNLWRRFRFVQFALIPWLLAAAYITNIAWSPSPIGNSYAVWARNNPRAEFLQEAVEMVPDDASVTATYNIGPHLSRRTALYDWPNPFWPAYWGNEQPGRPDCRRLPSASVVDYLALDLSLFPQGTEQRAFIDSLTDPQEGPFEIIYEDDFVDGEPRVIVAERVSPGPDGKELPVNCPGGALTALELIGQELPTATVPPTQPLPITPSSLPISDEPAPPTDSGSAAIPGAAVPGTPSTTSN